MNFELTQDLSNFSKKGALLKQCRNRRDRFKECIILQEEPPTKGTYPLMTDCWGVYDQTAFAPDDLNFLAQEVHSKDETKQYVAVEEIGKTLFSCGFCGKCGTCTIQPLLNGILDPSIITTLINFMRNDEDPKLQSEALKLFKKCMNGLQSPINNRLKADVLPLLVKLTTKPYLEIAGEAVEVLGTIIEDCLELRSLFVASFGLNSLLMFLDRITDYNSLEIGAWTLANLCQMKTLPGISSILSAINNIVTKEQSNVNSQASTNAFRALEYLSDGNREQIEAIIEDDIISTIVQHLICSNTRVIYSCLTIINNISCGTNTQVDRLIKLPGVINSLVNLLRDDSRFIKSLACCVLSNIAAGNSDHVEAIITDPRNFKKIINFVSLEGSFYVKKEAIQIVNNILLNSTSEQMIRALDYGIVSCFLVQQYLMDDEIIQLTLKGIQYLLDYEKDFSNRLMEERVMGQFSKSKVGDELMRILKNNRDFDIQTYTTEILLKYFGRPVNGLYVGLE